METGKKEGETGDSLYVVLYLFLKKVLQHRICTLSSLQWRRQNSLSRLCRPEAGPDRRILLKRSSRVWSLCSLAMRTRKAKAKKLQKEISRSSSLFLLLVTVAYHCHSISQQKTGYVEFVVFSFLKMKELRFQSTRNEKWRNEKQLSQLDGGNA